MASKQHSRAYEAQRMEQARRGAHERAAMRSRRQRLTIAWGLVTVGAIVAAIGATALLQDRSALVPVEPIDVPPVVTPEPPAEPILEGRAALPTPPSVDTAEDRTWTVTMVTSEGTLVIELDGQAAPQAVASFVALSQDGFFLNTSCHRLVTAGIFVLQCGDPTGTGTGGPAYRFGPVENAPVDNVYPAGTLAMARQGNNAESMGSQFFIVYEESTIGSDSAGGYTVFGTVLEGLDMVERVAALGTATGGPDGPPAISVTILEVSVQ